jgi:hypothetical protein
MSQQIQITGGAKVRNLEGVLTGTAGVVNALGINVPSGIPQLDGSGKILVSQLPNSVMEYKGTWNAATNTPTLVNGTGNQGDVYLVSVAGTVNFGAGPITFAVGDQAIYSGTIWQKAGGSTGTVTSVAVTESGDALTITGSPITTSGTINIGFAGTSGQYINGAGGLTTFPSLTGYVPYTGATASVDLGAFSLTADTLNSVGIFSIGSGTQSGYIGIKQGTTFLGNISGYNSINANATKFILISDIGSTNYKSASFQLGSLTNNTERTYSFPDLSGTLALLEGTQTFTGAKTFANNVKIDNGVDGNYIGFKQYGSGSTATTGFTTLYSISTNGFGIGFGTTKAIQFDSASITTFRTYIFPDANGTLALTSDLSAYVTLATTQTISGAKTFSLDILVNGLTVGRGAGSVSTNTVLGLASFATNTTGTYNVAIGQSALNSNTTGGYNTAVGGSAMVANSTGSFNTAIGFGTLNYNTTGTNNVALGYSSLYTNTTGSQNTALGAASLYHNTTGVNNTAIGNVALQQNTTGVNNTAIGSFSSYVNTTGQNNTSVGASTLIANTTGSQNTAIGTASLQSNTTGESNVGVGVSSLGVNTIGQYNVALGRSASNANTTGNYNTALGGQALANVTTGSQNIAIGYNSGGGITTGSQNTIIGIVTGLSSTLSNNIILADGAGNIRYQWNGTNNVFGNPLSGTNASFASSGGSDTFTINHSSGSGIALNITKGGNGEGLVINKTSGSGNALSVTGSTSLGALSGTSATFTGQVIITNNNSLTLAGLGLNSFNLSVGTVGGISGLHIGVTSPFLSISESTGAATFASSIAGTTATFLSGSSSTIGLIVGGAGAVGATLQGQIRFGDAGTVYKIQGGQDYLAMNFVIGSTNVLSLASNSAATFSSSVTTGGKLTISADAGNEQFVIQRASNTNAQLIFGYHSSGYGRIQAVEQMVGYKPLVLNQEGGNVLIGTTTDNGRKLQVNGQTRSSGFTSGSGNTGSAETATPYGIINVTTKGIYYIYAQLVAGTDDVNNYASTAIVISSGSSAKISFINNGGLLTITLSGTLVNTTQFSGGTQPSGIDWTFMAQN